MLPPPPDPQEKERVLDLTSGISRFRRSERKPLTERVEVPSPFVSFADAYVELKKGNYAAAVEKFDYIASFYPIEGDAFTRTDGYALPYFAWASAKAKDPLGLERFLLAGPWLPEKQRFDYALALAFFAGLRGEHDKALEHLQRAFNQRPSTDSRPITTAYQWAEACEWLYLATGEKRYIDAALKWAKAHQRILPMVAWAYAMEAKYATSEDDRVRALGVALYLDPQSERVAALDPKLKERAKAWFSTNNPFARSEGRTKRES
jgi:tetratricopeptide (TPR) repeat protein